jgi:putative membrane protein insertion efficiency factor
MKHIVRAPALLAVGLIRLYQVSLGRLLPARCRFHPSCSAYAIEAIDARGLIRGGGAALWRLARCGPWTAGGLDPVGAPRHRRGALSG